MKLSSAISSALIVIVCTLVLLNLDIHKSAAETAAEQSKGETSQQAAATAFTGPNSVDRPAADQQAVVKSHPTKKFKPAAVKTKGTVDCSNIKAGEGAGAIKNIAYWWNIPADDTRPPEIDAIAALGPAVKYVTFEPDGGGWNNIR
jgi:hypothetical protein